MVLGSEPEDPRTDFVGAGRELFPGWLGLAVEDVARGRARLGLVVQRHHLAPNGYLHAAVVVAIADTACGYGCMTSLPDGATGFTTIELKTNFLATVRQGEIECDARMVHGGRTTQVWDAAVTGSGRDIARFRCTQLIVYPR